MLVYRAADTPAGKMVDSIRGIKIVVGEDLAQDDDMSRQEYIDKMSPEEKKQLEELKKTECRGPQGELLDQPAQRRPEDRRPGQEGHRRRNDALRRRHSARRPPKPTSRPRSSEIKTAKYTDIESLMTKDTGLKPDEALLWNNLGYGQAGLKKYDDAIASYKKSIDLESASKKPRMPVIGAAECRTRRNLRANRQSSRSECSL